MIARIRVKFDTPLLWADCGSSYPDGWRLVPVLFKGATFGPKDKGCCYVQRKDGAGPQFVVRPELLFRHQLAGLKYMAEQTRFVVEQLEAQIGYVKKMADRWRSGKP